VETRRALNWVRIAKAKAKRSARSIQMGQMRPPLMRSDDDCR
jgi:hypothetical protein